MEQDRKKTARLVHTETAALQNKAALDAYKELGVDKVRILGTLDSVTCSLCGSMDGMILPRTQLEQGVTEPPFHPNCRCTTVPYDEDWDYKGQRIAKDKDGKYYYVPETMSYEEWKREFVEGEGSVDFMGKPKQFTDKEGKIDIKAFKQDGTDNIYSQTYSKNAQDTIEMLQDMKKSNSELSDVSEIVLARDLRGVAAYDHVNNRLYVCEKLFDADYCKKQFDSDYFAAENAEETIKHELVHKKHWDKIYKLSSETGKSIDIAKQELEADLREYVVKQVANESSYISDVVSENAWKGFIKGKTLNELIADVCVKSSKHQLEDSVLEKLVGELLL